MKRILLILLCAVSLAASAQNYTWSGRFVFDSATADTTIIWAEKFRNQPWSMEVHYPNVDTTNVYIALVAANTNTGAYSYYPISGVSFPENINPTVDKYGNGSGKTFASRAYEDDHLSFLKFGIIVIKTGYRSGYFDYFFKQ